MADVILAPLSVVAIGAAVLELTQATVGVGLVGIGCYLLIWARIVQASNHHRRLQDSLAKSQQLGQV